MNDRRQFVLAGLERCTGRQQRRDQAAQPDTARATCASIGPAPEWLAGKPLSEQPLREHGRYMLDLYRRGIMRLAGRFADGSGGAMLFGADDDAGAQAIVAADPAVVAQTFTYELRQWAFVDWAALREERREMTLAKTQRRVRKIKSCSDCEFSCSLLFLGVLASWREIFLLSLLLQRPTQHIPVRWEGQIPT